MQFNLETKLSQKQKLAMTEKMKQSIMILQMPAYELREYINKEFEQNPIIDGDFDFINNKENDIDVVKYKEIMEYINFDNYESNKREINDEDDLSPFNFIQSKSSLKDYLLIQLNVLACDKHILSIVEYMIESLDERGYLSCSFDDIANEIDCSTDDITSALSILQSFEPVGIGARNLQECLIIQLKKKGYYDDNIKKIIECYLDAVADNKYAYISDKLKICKEKAMAYCDVVKTLDPKPTRGFYTGDDEKYIIPDATIENHGNVLSIIINDNAMPRIKINRFYNNIVNNSEDEEAIKYVNEKMKDALALIKGIEQRKSTLESVLEFVIEKQRDYFIKGKDFLKPMTIKEIAKAIGFHESTISRAIKEKYILTCYGTIRLRDLFTNSINLSDEDLTANKIKNQIKQIVENEDKSKPFSDQYISDELIKSNLNISRRTVAKYREELGIKSSNKRKRI